MTTRGTWCEGPSIPYLTVPETLEHLVNVIESLPKPPILMGHSFGGLLTQMLLATCAEPGWEAVADHALEWTLAHAKSASQRTEPA